VSARTFYSAAHVVADPAAGNGAGKPAVVDWDATLAFREHLWSLDLGIAEAMDTAQRGMGLDWSAAQELIRRTGAAAQARAQATGVRPLLACGAGTDQLPDGEPTTLDAITAAYETQIETVEDAGSQVILMASRALAATAKSPEDYARVYGRLLAQLREPAVLHWLGTPFDPALEGYWGSSDLDAAADSVLQIIRDHADKVDGIKISLLDADREVALRRRLPDGVRMYTGDDFNYPTLIEGDEAGFSHALLGIFDPIAVPAARALAALDRGDAAEFRRILDPTVPLARHIFQAPTRYYKTGVVFLAHLNGHQDHFTMVGGEERSRDAAHLTELYRLAGEAGALTDPELAEQRFAAYRKGVQA
jgi:hypothetical protein